MNLFYAPDITLPDYFLSSEESRHAIQVLRLRVGDTLQLINGTGGFFTAVIKEDSSKSCKVSVIESKYEYGKPLFKLHIGIAPAKSIDRMEWFLEKATEIGIDEISPLKCEHSERTALNTERLNKILVSSMKQSLKAYLPHLNELTDFQKIIQKDFDGQKFIAHCHASPLKPLLKNAYRSGQNTFILIGPEGDFSPAEVQLALQNGFKEISLGNSRLRTETAALVACTAFALLI